MNAVHSVHRLFCLNKICFLGIRIDGCLQKYTHQLNLPLERNTKGDLKQTVAFLSFVVTSEDFLCVFAGYRQSYSGSETSTDLSLSSSENLSLSLRQEPQGEENNQVSSPHTHTHRRTLSHCGIDWSKCRPPDYRLWSHTGRSCSSFWRTTWMVLMLTPIMDCCLDWEEFPRGWRSNRPTQPPSTSQEVQTGKLGEVTPWTPLSERRTFWKVTS